MLVMPYSYAVPVEPPATVETGHQRVCALLPVASLASIRSIALAILRLGFWQSRYLPEEVQSQTKDDHSCTRGLCPELLYPKAADRKHRHTFEDGHAALGEHVHALRRANGALAGGEAEELAAHVAGAAERQQRRVRAGQRVAACIVRQGKLTVAAAV